MSWAQPYFTFDGRLQKFPGTLRVILRRIPKPSVRRYETRFVSRIRHAPPRQNLLSPPYYQLFLVPGTVQRPKHCQTRSQSSRVSDPQCNDYYVESCCGGVVRLLVVPIFPVLHAAPRNPAAPFAACGRLCNRHQLYRVLSPKGYA